MKSKCAVFLIACLVLSAPALASAERAATPSWIAGWVERALFTTAVERREPVDDVVTVSGVDRLYFFTELREMAGHTAIHRWEYSGRVMAEVEFEVGGPRWRVWSSKRIGPESPGPWRVSVVNLAGDLLAQEYFYQLGGD